MLLRKKRGAPHSCFCVPHPQKNVFAGVHVPKAGEREKTGLKNILPKKKKKMKSISKEILRKRLGVAIGRIVPKAEFTWFFGCFCTKTGQPEIVRKARELDLEHVRQFSEYCGYDLYFPIPLPLW